jgi:hypothetical protein
MTLDRRAIAAVAGTAALLVSGGTALAAAGADDRGTRCEERLARIAERRGTTVAELEAQIKARLVTGIDAAVSAGLVTSEQAARLKQLVAGTSLCPGTSPETRQARGPLGAAAAFLGLSRAELRAQLPGTSLAALARKHGKSVDALKAALLAPAKERLAKAVVSRRISPAAAARVLERLERLVDRLVETPVPAR